ncbi:MAG: FAD-dependent oxidoreductase [Chloroflexi bacterium]|nr:FAD-dependent oxidoreductase [Chloroflexota bacterium]
MKLEKLFEPGKIGTLDLKNRIVMPAMTTNLGDNSGLVNTRTVEYYSERDRPNVGLVVIEATNVGPGGRMFALQLRIDGDDCLPGLTRLASAINKAGAKSAIQLSHGGRKARREFNKGAQPVAPSSITAFHYDTPRELTLEEIDNILEAFADGARKAQEAGFHAVELHAAHGYLIHNFLSPLTNKRTDRYGGDLESRLRFVGDIYRRIRARVGDDYPLIIRINADDYIKGGITLGDAQQMAVLLEEIGFNAISILAGYAASSEEGYIAQMAPSGVFPMAFPRGGFVYLGEGIKKCVRVPVITCGRINEPQLAERVLEEGKADFVAIGRGLLADAEFVTKSFEERFADIRKCVACRTCMSAIYAGSPVRCAVNAEVGKEKEFRIKPSKRQRKVLVVGGGPAGMEAARVAALRGHEVVLCESNYRLGGNLVPAAAVSFKKELLELLTYLSGQVQKLKVDIRPGTKVDIKFIKSIKPDVVVLATGAKSILPDIHGIRRKNVATAVNVLERRQETGLNPIVVGGGMVGCETAVFLAQSGRRVTLVSRRNTDFSESSGLAPDMEAFLRKWLLFELWPELGIKVIGNSTFKAVTEEGLIVTDRASNDKLIRGDTVVFALGLSPVKDLAESLKPMGIEYYEVGDCVKPRQIVDAIAEGAAIGCRI